jgi:hypothetical protein
MDDLVTVQTYTSRPEAEIARGLLESNGIDVLIIADDAGGMIPSPMQYSYGVIVKVQKKDFVKAKQLLSPIA